MMAVNIATDDMTRAIYHSARFCLTESILQLSRQQRISPDNAACLLVPVLFQILADRAPASWAAMVRADLDMVILGAVHGTAVPPAMVDAVQVRRVAAAAAYDFEVTTPHGPKDRPQ